MSCGRRQTPGWRSTTCRAADTRQSPRESTISAAIGETTKRLKQNRTLWIYIILWGFAVRVLVGSMAGGYLNAPSRVWSSTCGAHTLDCPGHVPLSQGHGRFAKCGSSRSQKRASCDLMTRTTLCVLDTNIPSASHERVAYDFRKRVRRACRSTTSFWCAAPTPREHRGQECMKFCTGHATIAHFATVPSSGTGLR